jgi:hypothetical protein
VLFVVTTVAAILLNHYVSQAVNPPQPRIVYMDPSKSYPETDGTGRPK